MRQLDYLPRKALLKTGEVDALPEVIDAWATEFNARPRHVRDALMAVSPSPDDSDPET